MQTKILVAHLIPQSSAFYAKGFLQMLSPCWGQSCREGRSLARKTNKRATGERDNARRGRLGARVGSAVADDSLYLDLLLMRMAYTSGLLSSFFLPEIWAPLPSSMSDGDATCSQLVLEVG